MINPIIILGPTAVGKSKAAIELALQINGEIISADSMQVYRGMDLGTAKPTKEEKKGIPHYLIDILNPDEGWTVSDFVKEAQIIKLKVQNKQKVPIIVGGTGLYLWTLLHGYNFAGTPSDESIRARLDNLPTSTLYSQLSTIDPTSKIHPNDRKRIIRALEVFEITGETISQLQENRQPLAVSREQEYHLIGLTLPRDQLYKHIEKRVDKMLEAGLIDEVKGLLAKGYTPELPSLQALGYKEVIEYLDGRWTKEKMVDELKKRTRHFARRQLTWFRRFEEVQWLEAKDTFSLWEKVRSLKASG